MTSDAREKRLRRAAQRQDLKLVKSRTRDRVAVGYGRYALLDQAGTPVFGVDERGRPNATLDEIEQRLAGRSVRG